MTKEELEKEAEEKLPQAEVTYCHGFIMPCEPRDLPYSELLRFETGYKRGYLAGAEPREKQIQIDAEQIRALQKQNGELTDKVKELEAQIEKLIDFVLSKTECCDVCPITDTCINSEGTCPYAGILSKGEEAVTREWLMQKIAKEIKEK